MAFKMTDVALGCVQHSTIVLEKSAFPLKGWTLRGRMIEIARILQMISSHICTVKYFFVVMKGMELLCAMYRTNFNTVDSLIIWQFSRRVITKVKCTVKNMYKKF